MLEGCILITWRVARVTRVVIKLPLLIAIGISYYWSSILGWLLYTLLFAKRARVVIKNPQATSTHISWFMWTLWVSLPLLNDFQAFLTKFEATFEETDKWQAALNKLYEAISQVVHCGNCLFEFRQEERPCRSIHLGQQLHEVTHRGRWPHLPYHPPLEL